MPAGLDRHIAPLRRIDALDAVRGVAVMGILLLNIVGFAMPEQAYLNPRAYGGAAGADLAVYLVNFVLFDGKMRALFSFLFGASTLLVIERAEAKSENPARIHFSRMIWLLLFGLAHLWLVWSGDILAHYALVGMIAFAFRRLPIERLLALAVTLIFAQTLWIALTPLTVYLAETPRPGATPDPSLTASLEAFRNWFGVSPPDRLAQEVASYRSGYGTILTQRFALHRQSPFNGLVQYGMETLAYMLIGMAALRGGVLTGRWQQRQLVRWGLAGLGVGVIGYACLSVALLADDFSLLSIAVGPIWLATLIRPVMALGWLLLLLAWAQRGGALVARTAAAGRAAFTNYLGTSLICTSLFYGYGLGAFGRLSRVELYPVVFAIWAIMLLWSKPWLARFRYGPFEWLWRSLARGKVQRLSRAAA